MSEEIVEYVASQAGESRRSFISKVLLTSSVFVVPVIASFTIGGPAAPQSSPLGAGRPIDEGSNFPEATTTLPSSPTTLPPAVTTPAPTNPPATTTPPTTPATTTTINDVSGSGGVIPEVK